jgi:hypothetical protein
LHIDVKQLPGFGIAAALGKSSDFQHLHTLIQGDRHDIAKLDAMARGVLTATVNANPAAFDQRSGTGAGFDDPRMPQPFIETLTLHTVSRYALVRILAIGRKLLLQRRQLGERRVRICGTITLPLARRAACERPMRRPTAVRTPITAALALKLAFVPTLAKILAGVLAVATLAWRPALARRPFRGRASFAGRTVWAFEIKRAVATAMTMPLPLLAIRGFAFSRSALRTLLRTIRLTVTMPIVPGPTIFRTAAGSPHLDHRWCSGFGRRSLGWRRLGSCSLNGRLSRNSFGNDICGRIR